MKCESKEKQPFLVIFLFYLFLDPLRKVEFVSTFLFTHSNLRKVFPNDVRAPTHTPESQIQNAYQTRSPTKPRTVRPTFGPILVLSFSNSSTCLNTLALKAPPIPEIIEKSIMDPPPLPSPTGVERTVHALLTPPAAERGHNLEGRKSKRKTCLEE